MATEEGELTRVGGPPADEGEDADRSSAEIRRDIQRTRADLDATVDALGRRLQPRRLLWEARHRVQTAARRAQDGPVREPAGHRGLLLAGAGVLAGGLVLRRVLRRRRRRRPDFPPEQQGI
jgi:hypothetical protein